MALRRLMMALALGCGMLVAAPASAWDADYGRVSRADGVLKPGCRGYDFHYRVRLGGPDAWGLELFLVGPGREGLASDVKLSGNDPRRGRGTFEVCRASTRPGKFRIRGKLTMRHDAQLIPPTAARKDERWIRPARFRLRRG